MTKPYFSEALERKIQRYLHEMDFFKVLKINTLFEKKTAEKTVSLFEKELSITILINFRSEL